MLTCPWAPLKVTRWFFFLPIIEERITSKAKVLCSHEKRDEHQKWTTATRMVGEVTRSSIENSLEVWPLKIIVRIKKMNLKTAIIIVCKIDNEMCVCCLGVRKVTVQPAWSSYHRFMKAKLFLPIRLLNTHTHTHLSSSIISGQWIFCQWDVHMHVYLSFPVGCNEHSFLDAGQLCYLWWEIPLPVAWHANLSLCQQCCWASQVLTLCPDKSESTCVIVHLLLSEDWAFNRRTGSLCI